MLQAKASAGKGMVDYLVAPKSDGMLADRPLLVLCLDASGSMGVTAEAEATDGWTCGLCTLINAAGATGCATCGHPCPGQGVPTAGTEWKCGACTLLNPLVETKCIMCSGERGDAAPVPGPPKSPSVAAKRYVSQFEMMWRALDQHLARLAVTHPTHRIGVVLFNSAVDVVGDGTAPTLSIKGPTLDNYDVLVDIGRRAAVACSQTIGQSLDRLRLVVHLHLPLPALFQLICYALSLCSFETFLVLGFSFF
jgi:hypothetical protein